MVTQCGALFDESRQLFHVFDPICASCVQSCQLRIAFLTFTSIHVAYSDTEIAPALQSPKNASQALIMLTGGQHADTKEVRFFPFILDPEYACTNNCSASHLHLYSWHLGSGGKRCSHRCGACGLHRSQPKQQSYSASKQVALDATSPQTEIREGGGRQIVCVIASWTTYCAAGDL